MAAFYALIFTASVCINGTVTYVSQFAHSMDEGMQECQKHFDKIIQDNTDMSELVDIRDTVNILIGLLKNDSISREKTIEALGDISEVLQGRELVMK